MPRSGTTPSARDTPAAQRGIAWVTSRIVVQEGDASAHGMKIHAKLAWPIRVSQRVDNKGNAPGPLLMLLEARAPWEAAALAMAVPWLNRLPAGDGHPVLVLPGLAASDFSTVPLRRFLRGRGHWTHAWKPVSYTHLTLPTKRIV